MLKYWHYTETGIDEKDIEEEKQAEFEKTHPDWFLVGDGSKYEGKPLMELEGDTVYGPAFPFGPEA